MKIIHVISSIDLSGGGPSKSVSDLALNQALLGMEVIILTKKTVNPYLKISSHKNLELIFARNIGIREIENTIINRKPDIVHGHGLWQLPVHNMSRIARKYKIPYVITPRGMLEPWALNQGKFKKRLALALYQRRDLNNASCVHSTAQMETNQIRNVGFKNPIATIPNGIDISEFPLKINNENKKVKTILFLSRIHPKKGIELLIEAWENLDDTIKKNWRIEIAGNGEKNYIASLEKSINDKSLAEEIKIIGPQFGQNKIDTYHRADLFILPTYSENFGVVVAEALACGIPVITTKGTPWEDLLESNSGWWIDIGVKPLEQTMRKVLSIEQDTLSHMGVNGRKLVEKKFSIQSVAKCTNELYEWILENEVQPEFVQ